jgi:phenylacetic acid degradation protein
VVGGGCIVGALTFVPADMQIPPRKVVVGNPARIVKAVSDEMLAWKSDGTALYQQLPAAMRESAGEPLREVPDDRPEAAADVPFRKSRFLVFSGRNRRPAQC